jgi:endonuclease/exonuclease/phosphatase family metal-dependent hydrolase
MNLLTFNLRHNADRWLERFPLVIEMLQKADPDVIAFQEVSLTIHQGEQILESLNEASKIPYLACIEPKWGKNPREGIALFTRFPMVSTERHNLPIGRRVAQCLTIDSGHGLVDIYNTHLHHNPPFNDSIRFRQAQSLLRWIHQKENKNHPAILMGDFNVKPQSKVISLISSELESVYKRPDGMEPPLTFPTPLVRLPIPPATIDYIFFSPGRFHTCNLRLVGDQHHPCDDFLYPSDHYGVAIEATLF